MSFVHWWHSFWNERRRNMYEIEYTTRFRRSVQEMYQTWTGCWFGCKTPGDLFCISLLPAHTPICSDISFAEIFPVPTLRIVRKRGGDCFPANRQPGFSVFRRVVNAKFHGFLSVRGLGWAENDKNDVSPTDEMQKTAKSTFRPRTKCKNQQNLRFRHGGNTKNGKIYVSATAEMQKSAKSTFRPRTKCRKRQNLRFAHGRNAENGKINVSATAEAFF